VPATPTKSSILLASVCETRDAIEPPSMERSHQAVQSAPPPTRLSTLSRDEQTRHAALLTFCASMHQSISNLEPLSLREWHKLLRWLDVSGLALSFAYRISETGRTGRLPTPIAAGLGRRLEENTQRTRSMLAESIAIQHDFQRAGLCYALLKGLSFWPSSVPRPELRSQFDLDYLVAEHDIPEARKILAVKRYRLYTSNGKSWEFKRNEKPGVMLKDMYKDTGSFRVELHAQPTGAGKHSPLRSLEWRELGGFAMPVLSSVDLFLGQGMHAFKHICSEYVRASHLLEFWRHVLFRYDDVAFWRALRERASGNRRVAVGLGVSTFLITRLMGEFAPEALTSWTVDPLPARIRLWVETYGDRIVLGSLSGSKLYLLLKRELDEPGVVTHRPTWQVLLPSSLPPPVIRAFPNDSLPVRAGRIRMQLEHICSRALFHFVEGLRFARESRRWRKLSNQISR
jgi:hypothetical protein